MDIVEMVDEVDAWEQLNEEPDLAYTCFKMYLDMGPTRKITAMPDVYPDLDVNVTRLTKMSSNYQWKSRSAAYDNSLLEERRRKFELKLNDVLDEEFEELTKAFKTSHMLRERIENDNRSSTYSVLNAWKNWVEAHGKITDELYTIAGKPKEVQNTKLQNIQAVEQTETTKVTDLEKIEEVTKSLRMIQQ